MKTSYGLFLLFLISPLISHSQILSNNLILSKDSIEIDWDIKDYEFSDALIYVARNNSKFDKTVTLAIQTKWEEDNKVFTFGFLTFDLPKDGIVSNIMDERKRLNIKDAQYLEDNNLRLEVNIKSITRKDLTTNQD